MPYSPSQPYEPEDTPSLLAGAESSKDANENLQNLEVEALSPIEQQITDTTGQTNEAANSVVEARTKLPPSARERVEELFEKLAVSKQNAEENGVIWTKTHEDKEMLTELTGILYEYANTSPELTQRLGVHVGAVRKYLGDSISTISETEEKVIDLLTNSDNKDSFIKSIEDRQKGTRLTLEQKKHVMALVRLLKKRDLQTVNSNDLLAKVSLTSTVVFHQWTVKIFNDENGIPKETTEELIPALFEQAKQELETAIDAKNPDKNIEKDDVQEQIENQLTEEGANLPEETVQTKVDDQIVESAVKDQETVEEIPANSRAENLVLIQEMVRQNHELINILQHAENNSPKAQAAASLLSFNQAAMFQLMGLQIANTPTNEGDSNTQIPLGNGHSQRADLTVAGNEIRLSPDTKGTITITELKLEGSA